MESDINRKAMDNEIATNINWNPQLERILSEEGERALCFGWLHNKSQKRYTGLNTYITIPTIIMSTLAGTASIGSQSIFANNANLSSYVVGSISISVGILNTISSYFGWAKRAEGHRISGLAYSKIHRFILIELSLPRKERMAAKDMLKVVRDQLDRMEETSPQIPDRIINLFREKFGETTPDVSKPEITNGLDPITVFVESGEGCGVGSQLVLPKYIATARTPLSPAGSRTPELVKTSNDGRIPDSSQTLSLVHPLIVSASGSNRT